jgi:4-amino-4-deoxy-L-arabinose transferase-like glycosyltransferase
MTSSRARAFPGRSWALGAAAVVGGTTVLYVWLIANESGNDLARVGAVLALFVLATACSIGAAVLRTPGRRHLAAAGGTGILLSLGVLALFSVGLLLLVAAGLLIMAVAAGRDERRQSSKLLVIVAFAIGAALPWALVLIA